MDTLLNKDHKPEMRAESVVHWRNLLSDASLICRISGYIVQSLQSSPPVGTLAQIWAFFFKWAFPKFHISFHLTCVELHPSSWWRSSQELKIP